MATILVVDDEVGIRALLSEILTDEGHLVELAENAAQARAVRERSRPDLVLLDIWMPDVDGISLLKEWGGLGQLSMPVIMMSGHGTIDTAVEATKFGASAFLEKPITLQKLLRAVDQALVKPTPAAAQRGMAGTGPVSLVAAPTPIHALGPARSGEYSYAGAVESMSGSPGPVAPVPTGPQSHQSFDLDRPLREARDAFEKSYFEFHLAKENGSMTRVAEKTGLERTHLYRKLKQLGVDLTRNKRGG
ncbi:MAG: response regulator [Aquincola sp.]|nr:response regulator [Aquincola sp.]MDH5328724.1 response regulator [Aquincola sp.]